MHEIQNPPCQTNLHSLFQIHHQKEKGNITNKQTVRVEKPEGMKLLIRSRLRWDDNIRMDVTEIR
jgi:hypothetical protein